MIRFDKASFSYGREEVFKEVSLEINEGEILCLFGPNGCGKSTLIQCLLGILRLKSGSVTLRGDDINNLKPFEIAQQLAYIPQIHQKSFPFLVIDVVLMGRASYTGLFSAPDKRDRQIAEEALEQVGMIKYMHKPYTQLSGGETQLVLVARALAQQTPVLVLDEPTSHLDFHNELGFLETVVRLVERSGLTVVMATHFPNHAFFFQNNRVPTRIALMNGCGISMQGEPQHVLTEGNMRATFNMESRVISYAGDAGDLCHIIPLRTCANLGGRRDEEHTV